MADYEAELRRDAERAKQAKAGNGVDHGPKIDAPTSAPETLDALKHNPIWVGWKKMERNGELTKVPYNPKSGRWAKCSDPSDWGHWWSASSWARDHAGHVGIVLAPIDERLHLAGIDLDSCRDPRTGELEPWAREAVERFNSYTEVSPSETGVKIFFLYSIGAKPELDALFGGAEKHHGRMFKRGGGDHPPAIEIYRSNRFFAVTGQQFETYAKLRVVPVDDVRWLIKEAGPAFSGKKDRAPTGGGANDNSRSGKAFREGARLKANGATYEQMRDALLNHGDAEINAWAREKGAPNDERELHRIFENANAANIADEKAIDGRPRVEAPRRDGPRLEIMRLLDKVLLTDEAEPPMRDLYWAPTEARLREPVGVHLLTADTTNAEDDGNDATRLPAPPQLSLIAHDKHSLGLVIEKHIEFYKVKKTKSGDEIEITVALAEQFINAYLAYRDSQPPRVWTIATMPLVLPNGEILSTNGLDRKRKILFRIDPGLVELLPQGKITGAEIVEAMNFLTEEWLCDVQTDYAGKCVLISMTLSIVQRALFRELPAYSVPAGKAEGGKTTAINMVSCAATGKPAAAAAWSFDAEERRKAIFALSRQNLPLVAFDNIPRGAALSCQHLEKALTTEIIEDRVLCSSDWEVAPSSTVFVFTGNAITTKGDLATRTLVARIVVDRPDPANREFQHPEPVEWTLDHRGEILAALYTILLGNPRLAQKPKDRVGARRASRRGGPRLARRLNTRPIWSGSGRLRSADRAVQDRG